MTDFDPALDDLASAYLDGVGTVEERARVEGDPRAMARVAEFRRARDAVRAAPPPLADAAREALLERVLADAPRGGDLPAPIAPRRRRTRAAALLAAAAAVLAVAFLAGAVALLDRGEGGDETAISTAEASSSAPPGAFGATDRAGPERALTPPVGSLGSFATASDLLGAIAKAGATTVPQTTTPPATDGRNAASTACPDAEGTPYTAVLAGRDVVVFVSDARVLVLDAQTCAVVADTAR